MDIEKDKYLIYLEESEEIHPYLRNCIEVGKWYSIYCKERIKYKSSFYSLLFSQEKIYPLHLQKIYTLSKGDWKEEDEITNRSEYLLLYRNQHLLLEIEEDFFSVQDHLHSLTCIFDFEGKLVRIE